MCAQCAATEWGSTARIIAQLLSVSKRTNELQSKSQSKPNRNCYRNRNPVCQLFVFFPVRVFCSFCRFALLIRQSAVSCSICVHINVGESTGSSSSSGSRVSLCLVTCALIPLLAWPGILSLHFALHFVEILLKWLGCVRFLSPSLFPSLFLFSLLCVCDS